MLPLLAKQFQRLEETKMLVSRPPPRLDRSVLLCGLFLRGIFGRKTLAVSGSRSGCARGLGLGVASWAVLFKHFFVVHGLRDESSFRLW